MKESPRLRLPLLPTLATLCSCLVFTAPASSAAPPEDTPDPLVEYRFVNADASPQSIPQSDGQLSIPLKAKQPKRIQFTSDGLALKQSTLITAGAKQLNQRVRKSGAFTIEAWVDPAKADQKGPARIVTLSKDSSNRNFTLGQNEGVYEVRFRTTDTSANGLPGLATKPGSLKLKPTHVVFTRSANGKTAIYLNGELNARGKATGTLKNWNPDYQLAIGDELSGGRSWLGTIAAFAIYDSALSPQLVRQRFDLGPEGKLDPQILAQREAAKAAHHFETKIAPLLSNHCLECHDSSTREGGLDLSERLAVFKESDSGIAVVPGKADESLVWLSVEDDSMPHDRPALSPEEKKLLKNWINEGATFSLAKLDPAIYQHSGGEQRWVQRLTVDEYIQTVKSVTGVDIETEARELLPRDLRADGFSNTAYNLNVGLKHVDSWSKLAGMIVERMDVLPFVRRFSNRSKFTDKDMADVISNMGEWVLRGPVSNDEIVAYRGITTSVAAAGGTFEEAMELLLEAMLQSPRFLYRIERQPSESGSVQASDYELASRLSYIIWGGPPDEELLKAARLGEIDVAAQAERMLQSPQAKSQALRFVADWLNLGRLKNLQPNAERFPMWSAELADDMQQETLQFAEHVVWDERQPLAALLNTQKTFASEELADFYELPETAASASSGETSVYDLTSVKGRGGLLTQGSILTVGGDDASMVTRGLLVMHELLRGVVKDPPPCVDTTPVPTEPGVTQRNIALQRIADNSCGGCHSKFEPLAFGLEKFDGIGRYHEKDEHGNELRDDGEILFPGTAEPVEFQSSEELMDLLAESDRVKQSLTWKVTQFALGRPLAAEDAATVDRIHQQAMKEGGTWHATIKAIVTSELVTKTK